MGISGGHARVNVAELDLSFVVPGFAGVYGGMTFPARKGPIDIPMLATSITHMKSLFTPNKKVEIGFDLGYFSAKAFLQKSDKLWIQRVIGDNHSYAGLAVKTLSSLESPIPWVAEEEDPTAYTFGADEAFTLHSSDPGSWGNEYGFQLWQYRDRENIELSGATVSFGPGSTGAAESTTIQTVADSGGSLNDTYFTISTPTVDYYVWLNVNAAGTDPAIADHTGVEIAVATDATADTIAGSIQVALQAIAGFTAGVSTDTITVTNDDDGSVTDSVDSVTPTGFTITVITQGEDVLVDENSIQTTQAWSSGEPIRLAASIGATLPGGLEENRVYYTVALDVDHIQIAMSQAEALAGTAIDITDTGTGTMQIIPIKELKEPGSFQIEIYHKDNENEPVEVFTCSRDESAKDASGNNIFIESALEASNYFRAYDNPLVLGTPKPQVSVVYLTMGDDGDPITDGKMIMGAGSFEDPAGFPVTCLMDAGWATVAFQRKLDSIAKSRHDCVALLSTPYAAENSTNYLNAIVDYQKNELNLGSSYSALYTPHCKVYDAENDREIWVSPDGYAGAAIAFTALNYEMWYPVAGFKRGALEVMDTRRRFSTGELSYLYDNDINPIRFYPGKGINIWGQKTLLGRTSALNRLNVRLLLIVLEPAIAEALENFLFDLNTDGVRKMASSMIEDYMEGIKGRKGVYDFRVQCDNDNNSAQDIDNHVLNVDLYLKPVKSIEFINFTVVITRTGMSFDLAASAK